MEIWEAAVAGHPLLLLFLGFSLLDKVVEELQAVVVSTDDYCRLETCIASRMIRPRRVKAIRA